MTSDSDDDDRWARARAIATEDDALEAEYAWHKYQQAVASRFSRASSSAVLKMFESGTNEKGEPLTQFEFGVTSATARMMPGPLGMLLAPAVLFGLALYGVGTLMWLNVLGRVELSQAYPFVGLGFVLTTLAGWWLFSDSLSAQRLVGIGLIIVGIVLVSRT